MKLSVVNCAYAAIKNMSHDLQEEFYVKENIPDICQIAYTCLELAASEKLRALRYYIFKSPLNTFAKEGFN